MKVLIIGTFLFSFWFVSSNSFNVLDYGAVGDGKTDDSQAFLKAWRDLCEASSGIPTLIVPARRTFLLNPIKFEGPCKSTNLHIQMEGKLVAPNYIDAWGDDRNHWLQFSYLSGLTINGGGLIDGRGDIWWKFCKKDQSCSRPTALSFHNCNGVKLSRLEHMNSQRNHISVNGCHGFIISDIYILAPEESPNTDGIDISASSYIHIKNSVISTGDDCIAINGFSSHITISGIICGPGHGISVGSLGKNGAYETVEQVHVKNCTLRGTQNGVRIKTWQGGSGYARKISFEHITIIASQNPIIIDQNYANHFLDTIDSSDVHISDITYRGVHGSSADERAISLNCGNSIGCTNIVMDNIQITPFTPGKQLYAICNNAYGVSTFVSPNVPCLPNKIVQFFP